LPAAIAGVLLHDFIKTVIYESPVVICVSLILGGIVLLYVGPDETDTQVHGHIRVPAAALPVCWLFQMLALVPGVSRSGAAIVGSLLMGTDKRSAAEFTFFIALPIMGGAFSYDLYKSREYLTSELGAAVIIGFAAAFVTAVFVVRYLLDFISRNGFAIFAYWRIFVGAIGLWGLLLFRVSRQKLRCAQWAPEQRRSGRAVSDQAVWRSNCPLGMNRQR